MKRIITVTMLLAQLIILSAMLLLFDSIQAHESESTEEKQVKEAVEVGSAGKGKKTKNKKDKKDKTVSEGTELAHNNISTADGLALSAKIKGIEAIMQKPELPNGCEAASLAMVLDYYGFYVDKLQIAALMPKRDFYMEGGKQYGADFRFEFAGDPASQSGYGCYAPCIETTGNLYFESIGINWNAVDVTGMEPERLYQLVSEGKPVIVWSTIGWVTPYKGLSWYTPSGESVTWISPLHCVVLIGYDLEHKFVTICDPLEGTTTIQMSTFESIYRQMGCQAVILMEGKT